MQRIMKTAALILSLACYLATSEAQTQTPVYSCANATGISFYQTNLFGKWYEVARSGGAPNSVACSERTVKLLPDNQTLSINSTWAFPGKKNVFESQISNITLNANNNYTGGYNVSFYPNTTSFVKLLNYQIYNKVAWIIGCNYPNASNANVSYGFILSNTTKLSKIALKMANNEAATHYTDFKNNSLTELQLTGCSGAAANVPLFSAIFSVLYLLSKMF